MNEVKLTSSKSIYNRLLIAQSYEPELEIIGQSDSDDVLLMRQAIDRIGKLNSFDCGHAGTVLRFLSLRLSRLPGEWQLHGSSRLFQRPQKELTSVLTQLGVQSTLQENALIIKSNGWIRPLVPVKINGDESSQFISAVLLNTWNLDFPIEIEVPGKLQSRDYLLMTVELLHQLGMKIQETAKGGYLVPKQQKIINKKIKAEVDASSAFAVAASAVLSGTLVIKNGKFSNFQPDIVFIDLLKKMGAKLQLKGDDLVVEKAEALKPIEINLNNCPDLFPVLAVLCSFAKGSSRLYGAPHLKYKESNRIAKTYELLSAVGVKCEVLPDGMIIHGGQALNKAAKFEFNPDHDHRMAMAAGLFRKMDVPVQIANPEVVNKSFPEYWQALGISI